VPHRGQVNPYLVPDAGSDPHGDESEVAEALDGAEHRDGRSGPRSNRALAREVCFHPPRVPRHMGNRHIDRFRGVHIAVYQREVGLSDLTFPELMTQVSIRLGGAGCENDSRCSRVETVHETGFGGAPYDRCVWVASGKNVCERAAFTDSQGQRWHPGGLVERD